MNMYIYIYIHRHRYICWVGFLPWPNILTPVFLNKKQSSWRSGVPVDRIEEGESDRLMHLEEILSKRIVGWESQKGGNAIWANDSDQPSGWSSQWWFSTGILPTCH